MNAEMKEAEKHITGMEKWCGLFVCPWNRSRRVRDGDAYKPAKEKKEKEKGKGKAPKNDSQEIPKGPIVQRITDDAREDEMEENLQGVGNILGNLKSMAQDMNQEIDRQNKQIDRIGAKVVYLQFVHFLICTLLFTLEPDSGRQDRRGQQAHGKAT